MTLDEFLDAIENGTLDFNRVYHYTRRNGEHRIDLFDVTSYEPGYRVPLYSFRWKERTVSLVCDNSNIYPIQIEYNHIGPFCYIQTSPTRCLRLPNGEIFEDIPDYVAIRLGLREFMFYQLRINSYHDSNMRTNEGCVRSSNFRATPAERNSNGPIETYLGFELEICGSNARDRFSELFGAQDNSDIVDHFDVSEDGSIRGQGYEMVSLPMTLAYVRENISLFDRIYNWVRTNNMYGGGSSMHIHFDNNYFRMNTDYTTNRLRRLITYMWTRMDNDYDNIGHPYISYIVGRRYTNFCAYNYGMDGGNSGDHSNWFCRRTHTTEIRRYGANLNTADMMNKLEFTMKSVETIKLGITTNLDDDQIINNLRILILNYYINKLGIVKAFRESGYSRTVSIFEWLSSYSNDSLARRITEATTRRDALVASFLQRAMPQTDESPSQPTSPRGSTTRRRVGVEPTVAQPTPQQAQPQSQSEPSAMSTSNPHNVAMATMNRSTLERDAEHWITAMYNHLHFLPMYVPTPYAPIYTTVILAEYGAFVNHNGGRQRTPLFEELYANLCVVTNDNRYEMSVMDVIFMYAVYNNYHVRHNTPSVFGSIIDLSTNWDGTIHETPLDQQPRPAQPSVTPTLQGNPADHIVIDDRTYAPVSSGSTADELIRQVNDHRAVVGETEQTGYAQSLRNRMERYVVADTADFDRLADAHHTEAEDHPQNDDSADAANYAIYSGVYRRR